MILVAYGTRPEIIKLFPVIRELAVQGLPFRTFFTGQHRDLYRDVRDLVPEPDFECGHKGSQPESLGASFNRICRSFEDVLAGNRFDLVVIQGDTTTACAVAQIAFYHGVRVAHVEAGLRTYDRQSPFPEEANRRIISQIADLHCAPTRHARQNLRREGVRRVYLTGNPIVDALDHFSVERRFDPIAVVTLHRRENHARMAEIFDELSRAAIRYPGIDFIFPMHPNPNVQRHRRRLAGENIEITAPLGYREMLGLVGRATLLISDSGGLQEEAMYFGKKILIVRRNTERPEILETGLGKLVGREIVANIPWALTRAERPATNPFGDGKSAARIARILRSALCGARRKRTSRAVRQDSGGDDPL
jgi:UDP-N-acetylglucosamine 2-epimerase (non-hydrolysing)